MVPTGSTPDITAGTEAGAHGIARGQEHERPGHGICRPKARLNETAGGQIETRLRFIFGLKVKSKLSSALCVSRKPAYLRRRSSRRSERSISSHDIWLPIRTRAPKLASERHQRSRLPGNAQLAHHDDIKGEM